MSPSIIVTPSWAHVVTSGEAFCWCGEPAPRKGVTFELEPGSDFGQCRRDCRGCARVLDGGGP